MKRIAKKYTVGLLCFLCCLTLCLPSHADDAGAAWGTVQGQQAVVYLRGAQADNEVSCQIGNVPVDTEGICPISELDVPMQTIILLDNSLSIPAEQRDQIKTILENVVGNRMPGEQFTIGTVAQDVQYLCHAESDYLQLKKVIDELSYKEQETHLTDGLYKVLDELEKNQDGTMKRIILVADGADHKKIGYTYDEVAEAVRQAGYPIYVIGCGEKIEGENTQLENLFALSRLTTGSVFYLPQVDEIMEMVSQLADWNQAVQITVNLPAEVCDGSEKMLRAVAGENTYTVPLVMPFAAAQNKSGIPDIPLKLLYPAAGLVVVIALAVAAVLIMRRRGGRKDGFERLAEHPHPVPSEVGKTELVDEEVRKTQAVWDDDTPGRRLILCDLKDPSRRLEVPLQGKITIGRDPAICTAVVGYDASVARHQCDIYEKDGRVMIQNQSKTNITMLNGQKMPSESALESGAVLKMGRVQMRVEIV